MTPITANEIDRDDQEAADSADHFADVPRQLLLELSLRDPELIRELCVFPEGDARQEFALNALKIGVLALRQARGQVDADLIQRETQRMLDGLETQLGQHSLLIHQKISLTLTEYFDPQSGKFQERVQRLVSKDGDLEKVLKSLVGSQDSELSKTLVAHVGQNSPLLKMLSPNESQGLLAALRAMVEGELTKQNGTVLKEFSLDNQAGALSRLVAELKLKHGELTHDLEIKINAVVKEFSLDNQDGALTRLVTNVDRAQRTISSEFNFNNEQSAFSRLKIMLDDTKSVISKNLTLDDDSSSLAKLKKELVTILSAHCETNTNFQQDVRETLARLETKREESQRSTRHGLVFEATVGEFVQRQVQPKGDIFHATGNETGLIKNCKKGDFVVELGIESAAPGAKIVLEAKEKEGYSLREALDEMKTARENRAAQMGVFVFSKKTAPAGLEPFARFGDDAVVVWDAEDATTDIFFTAAMLTARYLCVRASQHNAAQTADFTDIDTAVLEIQKQAAKLDDIKTKAGTIQNASEAILKIVETARKSLNTQVETLQEKVADLRTTLSTSEK